MNGRLAFLFIAAFSAIGCGTSQTVKKSISQPTGQVTAVYFIERIDDPKNMAPEHMRIAVMGYLKQGLEAKGILAKDRSQANRLVVVTVTSYRMRSGYSRALFGIFAGKDGMGATVTVRDASTNEIIGEIEISSYNLAAVGGEEDIARMEGQEIAKYLTISK